MTREISSFLSQVNTILNSISAGDLEDANKLLNDLATGVPDAKEAGSLVQHLKTLVFQLQEKTKQNQEQLKELYSTRDKFFSIISHDPEARLMPYLGFPIFSPKNGTN